MFVIMKAFFNKMILLFISYKGVNEEFSQPQVIIHLRKLPYGVISFFFIKFQKSPGDLCNLILIKERCLHNNR